jgi:ferrochelatase
MMDKGTVGKGKTGVLLVNVGTPNSANVSDVRRYLREFLSDGRVLTIPGWLRWILVNLIIVPFRAPKSAHAYKSIWTKEGSPLLVNSLAMAQQLQKRLGDGCVVKLAMRYAEPNLKETLAFLLDQQKVEELVVVPLYPQYSSSATGTATARVQELLAQRPVIPAVRVVGDFFLDDGFIAAQGEIAKERLNEFKADHVLMSYHGLPESHVQDATQGHCFSNPNCCDQITLKNRFCYRAQCFATSRRLAAYLSLSASQYSVSFQSRLGRTPWIKPYTDLILADLHAKGVRRLAVMVPSFVADCLETIEEIGDRARADWKSLGGEDFALIPCVNADPRWVDALATLIGLRS